MDDDNQNVQHPLLAALKMFEVAARSAFDTAAAFWRPWSGKREKQEAAAKQQQSNAPSEQVRQPIKRDQEVTVGKKPKAPTKRAKSPKPLVQPKFTHYSPLDSASVLVPLSARRATMSSGARRQHLPVASCQRLQLGQPVRRSPNGLFRPKADCIVCSDSVASLKFPAQGGS